MKKNDEEDDENMNIKVILLGETGVGKTNLINAVKGLNFNENTESTLNIKCLQKTMNIYKKNYSINLWDTAGQEKFRALNKLYYKESKIVLLVYDISNINSFKALEEYWLDEIRAFQGNEPILGLVGNKSDLSDKKEVNDIIAQKFAEDNNMKFKLCSCKDDPKSFNLFLRSLVKEYIIKMKNDYESNKFELDKDDGGAYGSCITI